MFIRYFVEIPRMRADVEAQLLAGADDIFCVGARGAEFRGYLLLAEIGLGASPARINNCLNLHVAPPIRYRSKTVLPVSWKPAFLEALIPSLDADIELGDLGPGRTQLCISAWYTPPLGSLDGVPDRALLHRVAETTAKAFLDRVAEQLSSSSQLITAG
jgi:hypothetical protein